MAQVCNLLPGLTSYEADRAVRLQKNIQRLHNLGLPASEQEALLASLCVPKPASPKQRPPKKQRVTTAPTRGSSRLAGRATVNYRESPDKPSSKAAPMAGSSPATPAAPSQIDLWEAAFRANPRLGIQDRADMNKRVAEYLAENGYFVADLPQLSAEDAAIAATELATALSLNAGSKAVYRTALEGLQRASSGSLTSLQLNRTDRFAF